MRPTFLYFQKQNCILWSTQDVIVNFINNKTMLVLCYAGHCQTVLFDFDLQSVILECIWYPSVAHAALKQNGIKSSPIGPSQGLLKKWTEYFTKSISLYERNYTCVGWGTPEIPIEWIFLDHDIFFYLKVKIFLVKLHSEPTRSILPFLWLENMFSWLGKLDWGSVLSIF